MKQTIMDKQQKWLLKRFHTACTRLGMSVDEKMELLAAYGVESSADLDSDDLVKICFELEKRLDPAMAELDKWRKRVMASIGGYLEMIDKEQTPELIKGMACRSTKYTEFNSIPLERLKNVYFAFTKRSADCRRAWDQMEKELLCNNK